MSRGDAMISSSQTSALVLATRGNESDATLAKLDELGLKRKSRWSEMNIPKKGRRWGLHDDIPYKPLPYIDLPVGLSEKETDQFLREQRLEDLIKKVKNNELEDVDPDIRPPSPPPIYDKNGSRLNTREVRIRKNMHAELNRLVRYMLKNVKDYIPPPGWKPQKLAKKFIIPIEKYPTAPFMGVIIGPRGVNHKKLQEETNCRIVIRGKDITDKWQSEEEMNMPQHVHVEGDTEEQIEHAEKLIKPLLNPESEAFELARNAGMEQLAMVNGFSIQKADQRCGICGAMGHLGFECPETNFIDYKMAEVTCSICGDKGHVSMDCPENLRKQKEENRDWKAEAEKKREMEKSYEEMMSELGMAAPSKPTNCGPIVRIEGVQDGDGDNDYNKDMSIPANLAGRFIGPHGSAIKAMCSSTGCHISLEQDVGASTNRVVIIRGPPEKREVGKKAVESWLRANNHQGPASGSVRGRAGWKFGSTVSDVTFGGSGPPPHARPMMRPGLGSIPPNQNRVSSRPPATLPPGVRVLGRDPPFAQQQGHGNFNNGGGLRHEPDMQQRFNLPHRNVGNLPMQPFPGQRNDRFVNNDRFDNRYQNERPPVYQDRYRPDMRYRPELDQRGMQGPHNPMGPNSSGYQGPNIRAVPLANMHSAAVPKSGMQPQLSTAKWTPGGMAP